MTTTTAETKLPEYKTIWKPLAGSQTLAITCPCNHILLEGTRGGGKTDMQPMYFRRFVGKGYGIYWKGVIFDREYKNLDDIISKTLRWFPQLNDGCKFLASNSDKKWRWPSGEELLFRVFKTDKDYWGYHGQEFPFIGWNELTKQPNSNGYDAMMSCNRTSFIPEEHTPEALVRYDDLGNPIYLPQIPLVVLSTTNPYGAGHNWVKARFVDPAPAGQVIRVTRNVFNPRTGQREDITKTQVRIFSSYKENRYLPPEYVLELESITDPNKREAWLYGNWDITSGGMFDDLWSAEHNIIEGFAIPEDWKIERSFDWGSSKPFSVGWWAISNGDDVQLKDGSWRSTVAGDIFRIAEWYGWDGNADRGLKLTARQVAKGIIEREIKWGIYGRVKIGIADPALFQENGGVCFAEEMKKAVTINKRTYRGVKWLPCPKTGGYSRVNGWELMRIAIQNAQPQISNGVRVPREEAGLFVFRNCQDGFIRTVPCAPRDETKIDDVDTTSEDHCCDEVRYFVQSRAKYFKTCSVIHM